MPLGPQGTLRKALQVGPDYLRYFDPPYREADLLRARATPFVPRPVERILAAVLRRCRARGAPSARRAASRPRSALIRSSPSWSGALRAA